MTNQEGEAVAGGCCVIFLLAIALAFGFGFAFGQYLFRLIS